jgi:DNA-binding CsgD family transcriptional regulator
MHHDYLSVESLLLKARLFMAEGQATRALEALDAIPNFSPARGEFGEYLAGRALAFACVGELQLARELVTQAGDHTRSLHVRALRPCVLAIAGLHEGATDAHSLVVAALDSIRAEGEVDSFVAAYRSYPPLLNVAAQNTAAREWLLAVVTRARDGKLAARAGLRSVQREAGEVELLSAREREVLDLLAQGLTNREIAKALYISESTAKVHVRHIFEKLGTRTRVEAAMKVTNQAEPA